MKKLEGIRKLIVWIVATILLFVSRIESEHWFGITMMFLGMNAVEHVKNIINTGGKNE